MTTRISTIPKWFFTGLLGLALALGLSVSASPQKAFADTTPPPGATVVVSQPKYAKAAASATVSSYAFVKKSVKIELEFNMKSGIKQTKNESKNKGCKLVASEKKVPKGAKCVRLKKGASFTNSGRLRSGGIKKYRDKVTTPWMKFVKRGSHWYKAGYTYSKGKKKGKKTGNCGNESWFKGPKPATTYKQITLVSSFKDVEVDAKIKIAESGKVTALATVTCPGGSGASATSSASASYWVYVSVRIKIKYTTQIKVRGPASISLKQKTDVSTEVQAKAILAIKTEAKAWCKDSPPPAEKPVIVDITQINDVGVNETTRMCATFNVPGSDSAKLTFASSFAGFQEGRTPSFDVSGQDEKCVTYVAPTEVPTGGTDTITVTLRDNTTGQSATPATTVFRITNIAAPDSAPR